MESLSFEFLNTHPIIHLLTPLGESVELCFADAPENFLIGQNNNAAILQISDNGRATVFVDNSNVSIYFDRIDNTTNAPHGFTVEFVNTTNIDFVNKSSLILKTHNESIYLDSSDCVISNIGNNNVLITMLGLNAMLTFSLSKVTTADASSKVMAQSVAIQSVDDGKLLIPASKRIPEFVISLYDDPDYQLIRPARFGVPVVSTVPAFVPDDSWSISVPQAEIDLMNLGVGTESRIVYFKVISDQTIDASIRSSLRLYIDLPSGTDTVVRQVSIPLEYLDSEDTNDIFIGQYTFHREDTVNYVDGFAYLSVKLPLRIQRNLPLFYQVSSDGLSFDTVYDFPARDAEVAADVVEPFSSTKTRAVLLTASKESESISGKKTRRKRVKETTAD